MEGRLFENVYAKVLDESSELTDDNIVDSLDFLANKSQHDLAILFLAGHGIEVKINTIFCLIMRKG